MKELFRKEGLFYNEVKEKQRIIYHPPLPKKKPRVTAKGRSGKVRHYDPTECFLIGLERDNPKLAHILADILITLWGSKGGIS